MATVAKPVFRHAPGVIQHDYYMNGLLQSLPGMVTSLEKERGRISVFQPCCGFGLGVISVTKRFPCVNRAVACDVNPRAADLTRKNVALNHLEHVVAVRCGSLFDPIGEN